MADETQAELGYGVRLQVEGVTPGQYADVLSQLTEIDPPELKADAVEATHHKSPNKHRERIAGMLDTGEIQFTGFFASGNEGAVDMRGKIGKRMNWRLVYPLPEGGDEGDQETWTMRGILTSFKPNTPLEGVMTYTATLTPAGQSTFGTLGA